ncbi:uncharacterized protein LOC127717901 [Mytilus californianus]|uniref:uncharacterized protein LOC127717901 n=1 Tax=Mytilus californianus TaxID=6549 RepID=UPI002246391B|nr:uncharacterized protein LOC127717901 [Mytilus californianus]XP_052079714.1 uncharacterized protein LOC127717901 [Mytilus californianus]XP_052079715.1 uncharacterized protein LOC127717901 [Mytilus californianus]XP_052079716.1 uncharacterized protein LOC127717901 [Mytilus californianus]
MKQEPTFMMKLEPRLKQLAIVGLIFGSLFLQWNGTKCLTEGDDLFGDKWIIKSLLASAVIELVFILVAFQTEEFRLIVENSESITIFFFLRVLSSALLKYYNIVHLGDRGTDIYPSLIPIIVLICLVICKGSRLQHITMVTTGLLSLGALFVTLGVNKDFTMKRIDYLSFSSVFATVLKLICLKHFKDQNIKVTLRLRAIGIFFAGTIVIVPILEFTYHSNLGTFTLVSSMSGLASVTVLYLLYNHVICTNTVLETSGYLMMGYLLHQILESESINILPVLFGTCVLIATYIWHMQQQVDDPKAPFKDISSTSHEMFTRMEFMIFMGGVIAVLFYVLQPRVSSRDINNLSYVGLDKIVRKLLQNKVS